MKKIISIICVVMLFAVSGCSSVQQSADSQTADTTEQTTDKTDKETLPGGTGNEISIEDIFCSEEQDIYKNYVLKVRNNLDVNADGIRIQCKLLDSSGDTLDTFEWLFTDIEAGKASNAETQVNTYGDYRYEDAYAFKLYSYEVVNYDPWETLAKADFPEPIVFNLADIPGK